MNGDEEGGERERRETSISKLMSYVGKNGMQEKLGSNKLFRGTQHHHGANHVLGPNSYYRILTTRLICSKLIIAF